jgi:hypothetical protein
MKVLYEDGLHRHLQFRKPDTSSYWFDIITWPGNLCITGDMGTYVFRRIEDMLDFFRIQPNDWNFSKTGGLSINPSYWEEKLSAMPKDGTREFDEARFNEVVKEEFDAWCADNPTKNEFFEDLWDQLEYEVLGATADGHHAAVAAAMEFNHGDTNFQFVDFWEHRLERPTFHYIWCCYAIAWAVKTYDELSDKHIMELAERNGH